MKPDLGMRIYKFRGPLCETSGGQNMFMESLILLIVLIVVGIFKFLLFEEKRKRRRDYYRNDYLNSEAWKRKRYVVLKRDNWRCVYCGAKANQVHHKGTQRI